MRRNAKPNMVTGQMLDAHTPARPKLGMIVRLLPKRVVGIGLAALVVILLTGCGQKLLPPLATPTTEPTAEATVTPTPAAERRYPSASRRGSISDGARLPLPSGMLGSAPQPAYARIPYVDNGAPQQVLNVYLPTEQQGPFPTIFFLHGVLAPLENQVALAVAEYGVARGFAVVSIDFRVGAGAQAPAFLEDGFCALGWLYERGADYGIDTQRVVAFGHSLGGWIAANLATVDDPAPLLKECPYKLPVGQRILGAVTFEGGFFVPGQNLSQWQGPMAAAFGMSSAEATKMLSQAEKLTLDDWCDSNKLKETDERVRLFVSQQSVVWVSVGDPPLLLLTGPGGYATRSRAFADTATAAGVAVRVVMLPDNRGHGELTSPQWPEEVDAFLTDLNLR